MFSFLAVLHFIDIIIFLRRFRWDDYDLRQNNDMDYSKRSGFIQLGKSSSSGNVPGVEPVGSSTLLRTPPNTSQKRPPIKLDGMSAEILSATIRRLRLAEQRVSVLEAYNNQLRDENQANVKRMRQYDETVSNLRSQLLTNTDKTARQMEDVLSAQLSSLKQERDSAVETVERLKPLQIQLAGANFEKRLLQEAMEEENKQCAQLRRDREQFEAQLFNLQGLVQRQRLQLTEADKRESELTAIIEQLTQSRESMANRLIDSENATSDALSRVNQLSSDLEAATRRIDSLRVRFFQSHFYTIHNFEIIDFRTH